MKWPRLKSQPNTFPPIKLYCCSICSFFSFNVGAWFVFVSSLRKIKLSQNPSCLNFHSHYFKFISLKSLVLPFQTDLQYNNYQANTLIITEHTYLFILFLNFFFNLFSLVAGWGKCNKQASLSPKEICSLVLIKVVASLHTYNLLNYMYILF